MTTAPAAPVRPELAAHPTAPDGSSAEALLRLTESAAAVAAVRAAAMLGVLRLFAEHDGWLAVESVAGRLELSTRGTGHLLDALAALGVLDRSRHGYRSIAAGAAGPATSPPMWDALAESVRTGTGHLHVDRAESAANFYGDTVSFISAISDPFAVTVARRLGRLPGRRRVLEVGSGAAPWSRAIARLDPGVHVTALDLPPVLEVTRRHVVDDGLGTQYSYAPGDALTLDLSPAAYDLVLVPNVCRLFDAATNLTLLARLARAVAPGGRLAVVDTLPGESPGLARRVSLYALGLMIRTDHGGVHAETDYRRWFADAGLVDVTRWDVSPDHPIAIVLGRRPD